MTRVFSQERHLNAEKIFSMLRINYRVEVQNWQSLPLKLILNCSRFESFWIQDDYLSYDEIRHQSWISWTQTCVCPQCWAFCMWAFSEFLAFARYWWSFFSWPIWTHLTTL